MKKTMLNQTKGKKLKGFTLVELIVVMVILALLMALAIPQVTKYIDKAGEIAMKSEARACYTAVQAYCVDMYEEHKWQGDVLKGKAIADLSSSGNLTNYTQRSGSIIWGMANVPEEGRIIALTIEGTTVKELTYQYTGGGTKIIYKDGKYSVEDK